MTPKEAFAGGVAVITGAGSGIGEGLAHCAAELGMKVVLADIVAERIERVAEAIKAAGGTAVPIPTDVTDRRALERLADAAYDHFGEVRLLINNAGIETIGYTWEISAETWDNALGINLFGVIHGARIFAARMLKAGKPAYIANVASVGALSMMPTQAPYMLTKHAVLSFTECLYLEMQLQENPVHVSAVLPGLVATRIFEDAAADRSSDFVERQRNIMKDMLAQGGLTPVDAGKIILKGIAAEQFWVSTHPEVTAHMAKARADYLGALKTPALAEEARNILEGI